MERADAHILLNKIYDGRNAGHIRAVGATLEEVKKMRMKLAKLMRGIERLEDKAATMGFPFHVQGRG